VTPTRLQLGTARLEFLPDAALARFLDKSWMHYGDPPDSPSWLRATVRRLRLARRGLKDLGALYAKTNFEAFYFQRGGRLPFSAGSLHFVFSEHFFEHLFLNEALELFRECHRVLAPRGVLRVSVPDADLRTYEAPEPVGFPDVKLPFTHPNKHKTRWSVYSLCEAIQLTGFEPHRIRYCDQEGRYVQNHPVQYAGCPETEFLIDLSYLKRPNSLIVDGVKGA
jgi:predicted SAM-dependent methyltransferase